MKHLFIINPVAGGRDKTAFVTAEAEKCFPGLRDCELYVTRGPMDARDKIVAAAETGETLRVYACGGDGTLNECVCGAAGRANVAVTHFPCGTGNDFIKTFGAEKDRFFSLAELAAGEVRPLDLIDCNGRASINICSVGVDARIGTDVHKYSRLPLIGGACGYVVSTVVNLAKGVSREMRVSACGREFEGEQSLICVCNGRYYGGGFNPVPTARPDDGVLDMLVVKGVSRLTFLRLVGGYARGCHRKYPQYITHLRGDGLVIDSPTELRVNVDGELLRASHVEMRVVPGGVNFLFPANLQFFENQKQETDKKTSKWEVSVVRSSSN